MHVLIAGGGTAGWMTASYIKRVFGERVKVTLVESPRIGTIGVGEATFSTLKLFFDRLGLPETDWLVKVNGSYKLAIRFQDWTTERGHFYHPFERMPYVGGAYLPEWWQKLSPRGEAFDYSCFITPHLCDAQRAPRFLDGTLLQSDLADHVYPDQLNPDSSLETHRVQCPYGYHFDAGLLAAYLRDYAVARGVTHIGDDIVSVEKTDSGDIAAVVTREHGRLAADLFVDCSGFRALLIGDAMEEPFISYKDSLFCDAAVAMQVPSEPDVDGIAPYTTAHAQDAGWIWRIPLYSRDGSGYVYSSRHIDAAEAERTLRSYHGARAEGIEARHIKMRVGRHERVWVRNCMAIGLCAGFVEPLESTTIFFIQQAIEELCANFPSPAMEPALRDRVNKSLSDCVDGVRDFLVLHYFASDRSDTPFWRDVQTKLVVPEHLRESLRLWQDRLPTPRTVNHAYHGFDAYSWTTILLGLHKLTGQSPPALSYLDPTPAQQAFEDVAYRAKKAVADLPSVYEYLTAMRNGLKTRRRRSAPRVRAAS
ncbi:MAG: tryptophan halogenase family protein [Polyangiaceae bacterium]